MDPITALHARTSRRELLQASGLSLGSMALGSLLARDAGGQAGQGLPLGTHFAPRAKRVVWLHMAGAPSQLDLFDEKPLLVQRNGEAIPESFTKGERFAFIRGTPKLLGSPYAFARHGASGQSISELLPHTASIADRIAIVRGLSTEQFNHAPAQVFMNSGHALIGRPSMGSWLSYGLGALNQDLPSFVVLVSGKYDPSGGASLWSSGFLPSQHQGVRLRSQGDPVLFLSDPPGIDAGDRARSLAALRALDQEHAQASGDPEVNARIAQYELAARMQSSVPELADLSSEDDATLEEYGAIPNERSFANNCLLARRLLERGSRFVQLYHWGWDSHGTAPHDDIVSSLPARCLETDRASAALVRDLERRGLLEDTLVVWGGEFGRTPMNEERGGSTYLGRDHHPHAFTMWLAGGGIQAGVSLGATDELGYHVTEDPMSVHDLHATLLHQLGLDHERLTFRSQGRDFRLTDVSGNVQHKLLG